MFSMSREFRRSIGEDTHRLGRGCTTALVEKGRRIAASSTERQSVVAFALKAGRVVSIGVNSYRKTHPRQAHYARIVGQPRKEFLHAEIAALVRAKTAVDTLVVLRFDKEGNPALAKPCAICQLAIAAAGITNVVHT